MTSKYSQEEIALLDPKGVPAHVAIIPDGNRRWAKQFLLHPTEGHPKGADVATNVVVAAQELGVKSITIYTFSTENWQRTEFEVSTLLYLLNERLLRELPNLKEKGIVFRTIGDLSPFPEPLLETIEKVKEETRGGKGIDFIMALNYGGRDELRRALSNIVKDVALGKLSSEEVSENLIGSYLDTAPFGDPDLIIRTSGEMRTSNFLLWQNSYSEWVLVDKFWPAFTPKDLLEALLVFQKRDRRMGGG